MLSRENLFFFLQKFWFSKFFSAFRIFFEIKALEILLFVFSLYQFTISIDYVKGLDFRSDQLMNSQKKTTQNVINFFIQNFMIVICLFSCRGLRGDC